MPKYRSAGISVHLSVADLSPSILSSLEARGKGPEVIRQADLIEKYLKEKSSTLDEIIVPCHDDRLVPHYLQGQGNMPFIMVQASTKCVGPGKSQGEAETLQLHYPPQSSDLGSPLSSLPSTPKISPQGSPSIVPLKGKADQSSSVEIFQTPTHSKLPSIPQALALQLKLSRRSFLPSFNVPNQYQDLKIEIFFNGDLTCSTLYHARNHPHWDTVPEVTLLFSGSRVGNREERPWILFPSTMLENNSTSENQQIFAEGFDQLERWKKIGTLLSKQAEERGYSKAGTRAPTGEYLTRLAELPMPEEVKNMRSHKNSQYGVIDVVLCVGVGKKYSTSAGNLTTPEALQDPVHPPLKSGINTEDTTLENGTHKSSSISNKESTQENARSIRDPCLSHRQRATRSVTALRAATCSQLTGVAESYMKISKSERDTKQLGNRWSNHNPVTKSNLSRQKETPSNQLDSTSGANLRGQKPVPNLRPRSTRSSISFSENTLASDLRKRHLSSSQPIRPDSPQNKRNRSLNTNIEPSKLSPPISVSRRGVLLPSRNNHAPSISREQLQMNHIDITNDPTKLPPLVVMPSSSTAIGEQAKSSLISRIVIKAKGSIIRDAPLSSPIRLLPSRHQIPEDTQFHHPDQTEILVPSSSANSCRRKGDTYNVDQNANRVYGDEARDTMTRDSSKEKQEKSTSAEEDVMKILNSYMYPGQRVVKKEEGQFTGVTRNDNSPPSLCQNSIISYAMPESCVDGHIRPETRMVTRPIRSERPGIFLEREILVGIRFLVG